MNETPIFMEKCFFAVRGSKTLAWAVYVAASEAFGGPVTEAEIAKICDRPKTPKLNEYRRYKQASVWLARHFNPVYLAFTDGRTDAELAKIWMNINRGELGRSLGGYEKRGSTKSEKMFKADNYVQYARKMDKRHDWNTVK